MNFETEPLVTSKRKREDKEFIELTDEELLLAFADDVSFVENLKQKQTEAKEKYEESPTSVEIPAWKDELQKRLENAHTLEEVDLMTKEFVKKNKPRKEPKKKLMRVENFYQRHIGGLEWMNSFLQRTKSSACSRPFVERMLVLENQFKDAIEKDPLLGPHLEKD